MIANHAPEWSALERRVTRRAYVFLGICTGFLVLLAGLGAVARHPGIAVSAGAVALLGAFDLLLVRRRGVFGRTLTARRHRAAAITAALIGVALLGFAVLYAIQGLVVPALVYSVAGTGGTFLLAAAAYLNARVLERAAAAVAPEPARVVCADQRGLRRGARPLVLVVTPTRVAHLQVSDSGVSEVASIVLADIAQVEADASRGRGTLVLRSAEVELAVHRAPPSQVHAVLEALRSAGVVAGA
jgi:hypothetical protein